MPADLSPVHGIFFSSIQSNGLSFRVASNIRHLDKGGAQIARIQRFPLVLFLHGFPESWYSWRHQLSFLRDRPILVVAPDMRGYGSTTPTPQGIEAYTQPELARDVVGIANHLGYEKFVVVGHDWGAKLAWSVALLYPKLVLGVCGMSVPYAGTPKKGLLTMLQDAYGKCLGTSLPREELEKAMFHYILHHCLPRCDEEYDRNAEEFLYRVYTYRKGCRVKDGTPEQDVHGLMFPPTGNTEDDTSRPMDATSAPGWWLRIPRPTSFPLWFTQRDLDYYVGEFKRAGFYGALCWYRAADRNHALMKEKLKPENGGHGDKVLPPSLFLIGENDALLKFYGGKAKVIEDLMTNLPALTREPLFLPSCGHWMQQERPQVVNNALMKFLDLVIETGPAVDHHSKL